MKKCKDFEPYELVYIESALKDYVKKLSVGVDNFTVVDFSDTVMLSELIDDIGSINILLCKLKDMF